MTNGARDPAGDWAGIQPGQGRRAARPLPERMQPGVVYTTFYPVFRRQRDDYRQFRMGRQLSRI